MIKFLVLFGICCVFVQGMSISDSERTDNRSFLSLMKALRGRLEARFQGLGQKVKPDSGDDDPSNIGECFPNPCQNMGICIPGLSSYRCNCINPVYTGKNCEYIGCFSIPWPSFLSFLPQPFTTDCPTSGEICALGATFRPECVCEDSLNCPSTK